MVGAGVIGVKCHIVRHIYMKKIYCLLLFFAVACSGLQGIDMVLVPAGNVTDKTNVDIRTGIINKDKTSTVYDVCLVLRNSEGRRILSSQKVEVAPESSLLVRDTLFTEGLSGKYQVVAEISKGLKTTTLVRPIEIVPSEVRSPLTIDGAWTGLYHWSEQEALHWNKDIRKLTADDWKGVIRAMHHIGMDVVVVQELFRKDAYVNHHDMTAETYDGAAYYPTEIVDSRVEIACEDPLEAIMEEADRLGMSVFPGIGLYAWFDYSQESLEWHKTVTEDILDRYGHHESFYGFYVSEEAGGSLDNWEKNPEDRKKYAAEMISFFREYSSFCKELSPAKPIMLATNCFGINGCDAVYAELLKYLDILCPFGFSRMEEGDLSAKEAASKLQQWCDNAGCHLWMDLEAFTFNPDGSLSPRSFNSIKDDLNTFTGFEKVLCYQYPGVFSNPSFHPQVGEDASRKLYTDYMAYRMYMDWLKPYSIPYGVTVDPEPQGIYPDDTLRKDCVIITGSRPETGPLYWQAVPSIAATSDGSLIYEAWNAGGRDEEMGNYLTVAVSEDMGHTWKRDVLTISPKDPSMMRILDGVLWRDSAGEIRLKYSVTISAEGDQIDPRTSSHEIKIRWNGEKMEYDKPRFIAYGLMINPPLEFPDGKAMYPIYRCSMNHLNRLVYKRNPERGTYVYLRSGDRFKQFSRMRDEDYSLYDFDEHQFTLLKDGSLMSIARFRGGLRSAYSFDAGKSWTDFEPVPGIGPSPSSKARIMKLESGRLLLLYNNAEDRSHMTAALSDDDGRTWPYKVVIDPRPETSYPSACQIDDGTIVMAYDRSRYKDMDIFFCSFREEDILAGKVPPVLRITDL